MAYAIAAQSPGGSDKLHEIEITPPIPGPGEVMIRQTAVGLNFLDIYFRTGLYPWPVEQDLILGSEGAGVVEVVGEGVHGISVGDRPCWAYHDHSKQGDKNRILRAISEGKSVSYASEAGTPLVADPGYRLAREVSEDGAYVTAVPGASAALANIGPGLGNTIGPAGNFASLNDTAKWLLIWGMLIGRLEVLAVFAIFTPHFWRA